MRLQELLEDLKQFDTNLEITFELTTSNEEGLQLETLEYQGAQKFPNNRLVISFEWN